METAQQAPATEHSPASGQAAADQGADARPPAKPGVSPARPLGSDPLPADLRAILQGISAGVTVQDEDGRLLFANDDAARLSGFDASSDMLAAGPGELIKRLELVDEDGVALDPALLPGRRAIAGELPDPMIVGFHPLAGGDTCWSMLLARSATLSDGRHVAVNTFHDVTARVETEQRIRASEKREAFLARASEVLASSFDYEKTVQTVADLAVPEFADWCVVQLAGEGDGGRRQVAVAHRDPALVALAERMLEEYPPDPNSTTGAAAILRTGKSEYVPEIPGDVLDAAARDERHREMIRVLALRSYVSVPLLAMGKAFGVLTLVASDSSRRFEPGDVAFAENLAARAAAAIESARLFREGVRFKRLLDATGDAVLMLEPGSGRIVYANRGAAQQLEGTVDELIGSLVDDHLDASGAGVLSAAMTAVAEDATAARTVTVELHRPDGSVLPVEVRLEYVAPDGAPARILAIARDIRDRIQAQERLRGLAAAEHARAAELNAVIRAMGDGVVVCDRAGRILLANPAAEDTFPEVDETTYGEILAQLEDPDGLAPALGGRGGPVELRVRSEEERWIEISTWPVAAGREHQVGHQDETIVLLRDVTAQRQRQAVRDTFIGVLSHELRTPVTTIYAGAKVLGRPGGLSDATRQEIFDDIVVESERLHRLVEDVVAMTRFQDEGGDVGAEPVLLQRLLPSVIASEESRWPGVTFAVDIPPGLPTVIADPTYVEQVVRNLLSNAAKYGGSGTSVRAIVEAAPSEVLVRIHDDGPGFPPDERERLFDLFFRSAQTARAAPGAGIGLFVCARLIKAMGGRIWAANRPDGGAEFGFALRVMGEDD